MLKSITTVAVAIATGLIAGPAMANINQGPAAGVRYTVQTPINVTSFAPTARLGPRISTRFRLRADYRYDLQRWHEEESNDYRASDHWRIQISPGGLPAGF